MAQRLRRNLDTMAETVRDANQAVQGEAGHVPVADALHVAGPMSAAAAAALAVRCRSWSVARMLQAIWTFEKPILKSASGAPPARVREPARKLTEAVVILSPSLL